MPGLQLRDIYRSLIMLMMWCGYSSCALAQTGDVTPVHDPSVIQAGNTFYIFSTGRGLSVRTSTDLFNWKTDGHVFDTVPAWTHAYSPNSTYFWAPDISFINGEYRLYYAVSSFGKTFSAIGLAVNKTLDRSSPDFKWVDRGKVIDTPAGNNWNAIDPCAFEDADGNAWLALGSCWKGLKLVALDAKTGLLADSSQTPISLAANPPTNIIEESYIRRHGDFYYLWESVDHCCRGIDSNYRILVGRSKNVRGPYIDFDGKPMTEGGGTLVLASYDAVRGPGSCAIVQTAGRDFLIHHEYDADNRGIPTLQIRQLFYTADGWPMVGEPIVRPPSEKATTAKPVAGDWSVRYDFATPRTITLHSDGTLSPTAGTWHLTGSNLILNWAKAATTLAEECTLSDDGSFFVGRNSQGVAILGIRSTIPATVNDLNQIAKGTVIFHGGFDTDPRDHGRPVVLVAAALNVPTQVFRDAFSGVKPAPAGQQPQDEQVDRNKEALLKVLSPYGVTNDRLDTVSNFYRYNGSRGEMWKHTPATATAIITNGKVTGFNITNPGAGYSSAPTITILGYDNIDATVTLEFGIDMKTNGSIKSITLNAVKKP